MVFSNMYPELNTSAVRCLGLTCDHDINFSQHVSEMCRSCQYHIRDLCRIRPSLSLKVSVAKTITTTLVSSGLDYCNSLLRHIVSIQISKLQHVRNRLAMVLSQSACFSSSVPLVNSLHCLSVQLRIMSKICTIICQTLSSK